MPYESPPDDVVTTPSNKSKRLIALNSILATKTWYVNLRSILATIKQLNLPRTEQIKFNTNLNLVAIKDMHALTPNYTTR